MSSAFITSFTSSPLSTSRSSTTHLCTSRPFPAIHRTRRAITSQTPSPPATPDPSPFENDVLHQFSLALLGTYAALGNATPASAVPEALVEAFKSKPASLTHPAVMWLLTATTLYTFYLGFQSSRLRSAPSAEKKKLAKGKFGQKHFQTSSTLFAIMTIATFGGMANTYARTGKLFPGPHLYAGLGLVATFSVMSSLVPYMQKGKAWARNTHFGLAFVVVGLFGWQTKSGMVIVGKLLGWE